MADIDSSQQHKSLNAGLLDPVLGKDLKKEYSDLAELASAICNTPIAIITLFDQDHKHLTFSCGIGQMDPHSLFYTYAIQDYENLVQIEDLENNINFPDNPLVKIIPGIRFYAGVISPFLGTFKSRVFD